MQQWGVLKPLSRLVDLIRSNFWQSLRFEKDLLLMGSLLTHLESTFERFKRGTIVQPLMCLKNQTLNWTP